ncbi:MAG TPA: protein-disulfide reductase DsbD domain-containing protein [Pirellulales bacterium]|nr:protein-disulfide reductase DsbD domain-containing protein [Pirellulales bacterium]
MRTRSSVVFAAVAAGLVASLVPCARVQAQLDLLQDLKGVSQPPADTKSLVTASAAFNMAKDGRKGRLVITAEIADEWHIYSITQAAGGPVRSEIKLKASPDYKVMGSFKASPEPKKHVDDVAFPGLTLEEHEGTVTWSAPLDLAEGVDPQNLKIEGKVFAQTCREGQCLFPQDFPFTATLDPALSLGATPPAQEPPPSTDRYEADGITFSGHVSPRAAGPGDTFRLTITAEPEPGWHVYELSTRPGASVGSKPTLLHFTRMAGLKSGPVVASEKPVREATSSLGHHEEPVTWTVELTAAARAKPGPITVEGALGYQICKNNDGGCKAPAAIGFAVDLAIGKTAEGQVPLKFVENSKYTDVEKLVKNPGATSARGSSEPPPKGGKAGLNPDLLKPAGANGQETSLAWMMGLGFLGGLILNLMPCVLPVIGLKILSFVEQSGHSRQRAFLLNLWYSAGMLAVFMALATLPVVSRLWFNQQFGWGQQFSYDGFNITLAGLVFVMALSFLGVWEIPIPGFAGGNKAGQLAAKEGFSGAFAKGAVTTVLATPCSGPFLGSALGFAVAQPPLVTYLMFASIGLGMASPYLLIGAYPQLIRFLPKPGAWMDTFKQTMGFVLLATVVYLLTLVKWQLMVPTFALLVGLWAGCWWIGRTPLYAELPQKLRAWGLGSAFAGATAVVAFQWVGPVMQERFQRAVEREIAALGDAPAVAREPQTENVDRLPWRPFSMQDLVALTNDGKTVMVDFTADWCVTCKTLERLVLNTAETKQVVTDNGVVTMVADMTRYPQEESKLLEKLTGGRLVPVLAIFPAGRPNEPIVLNNGYTKGLLFDKLKEAGPSRGASQVAELTALSRP